MGWRRRGGKNQGIVKEKNPKIGDFFTEFYAKSLKVSKYQFSFFSMLQKKISRSVIAVC